jgi:hypothetical protein
MHPGPKQARNGDLGIACRVFGDEEINLLLAYPFISHLDLGWESPLLPDSSSASEASPG